MLARAVFAAKLLYLLFEILHKMITVNPLTIRAALNTIAVIKPVMPTICTTNNHRWYVQVPRAFVKGM